MPAQNDIASFARNPTWVLLNRRDTAGVTTSRTWYGGRSDPAPGCVEDVNQKAGYTDCHEFPFFKTLQAYEGSMNNGPLAVLPSIRWTPPSENRRQGTALGHFFSTHNGGSTPTSFPFDGCDIFAKTPQTVTPQPTSAFLNVPVGKTAQIKTTGICNKPTP